MSTATYYDLLNVSREAGPDGVRAAYRSLAQRYHPDKLQGSADASRVMAALNEAYAVLSDPQRRAHYDRSIQSRPARCTGRARASSRPAPVEEPDVLWPWWLLVATVAIALLCISTVVYRMIVPTVTVPATQSMAPSALTPPPSGAQSRRAGPKPN